MSCLDLLLSKYDAISELLPRQTVYCTHAELARGPNRSRPAIVCAELVHRLVTFSGPYALKLPLSDLFSDDIMIACPSLATVFAIVTVDESRG